MSVWRKALAIRFDFRHLHGWWILDIPRLNLLASNFLCQARIVSGQTRRTIASGKIDVNLQVFDPLVAGRNNAHLLRSKVRNQ